MLSACKTLNSEMASSHFRCYKNLLLCFFLVTGYLFSSFTFAANRFTIGHSIRDGETIISERERFALGFFSPQGSSFRYVGIWYYKVANEPVVWVANRETPVLDNGGALTIGNDGNLIILNGDNNIIWSSNVTVESINSTVVLWDTGNPALYDDETMNRQIWQSFDHPTDSYLLDMRIYVNDQDAERRVLTSWKSVNDPSPGNYSLGVDPRGSSQIVIWSGSNRWWRSGHYDGVKFTGVPGTHNYFSGCKVNNDDDGRRYVTYVPSSRSDLIRFHVSWEGAGRQEMWIDELKEWKLIQSHPVGECGRYNRCGAFGICNEVDLQKRGCIEGFVAKDSDEWSRRNWSSGCVRRRKLQCEEENNNLYGEEGGNKDGFVQIERVKFPDFVDYVGSEDIKECEKKCLEKCSCTAYAFDSGINCMIWNRDLVDVQQFGEGGSTLFVRLAHSELGDKNHVTKIVLITIVIVGMFFVCVLIWVICKCKNKCHDMCGTSELGVEGKQASGTELAIFGFNSVAAATDNFSVKNELGQGGFGHVYKGKLPNGQEIAVKRLAKSSNQGVEEFKNEVEVISKLRHRKSDIYSFGVLLLEIVSGRKNTSFYNDERARSLIAYAWKLWNEEDIINLRDNYSHTPY